MSTDNTLPEPVAWVKDTSILALRRDESTVLAYPHDYLIRPAVAIYTADQMRAAIARERMRWISAISKSMPAEFKDWHENSHAELPEIAAWSIEHLRRRNEGLEAELSTLRQQLTEAGRDAARYRWLRGGADIPLESNRWARWEVRYWCGRWWSTMFADQLDTAINAARGGNHG